MPKRRMPGDSLTRGQARVYKAVVHLYRSLNRSPTWDEVAELVSRTRESRWFSPCIRALRDKGYLVPRGRLVPLEVKPDVRITRDCRVRVWVQDQVLSVEEATELAGRLIEAAQRARRAADGGNVFAGNPRA